MMRTASHAAASTSAAASAVSEAVQSLFVYPLESNFSGARYDAGQGWQRAVLHTSWAASSRAA